MIDLVFTDEYYFTSISPKTEVYGFLAEGAYWNVPPGISITNTKIQIAPQSVSWVDFTGGQQVTYTTDGIRLHITADVSITDSLTKYGNVPITITLPGVIAFTESTHSILKVEQVNNSLLEGTLPSVQSDVTAIIIEDAYISETKAEAFFRSSGQYILAIVIILILLAIYGSDKHNR